MTRSARLVLLAGIAGSLAAGAQMDVRREGARLIGRSPPGASAGYHALRLAGYGDLGLVGQGDFDGVGYLDMLVQAGLNFARVRVADPFAAGALPWVRSDGRWDLDTWDDAYWQRLDAFVAAAETRGVVVQVVLFDRHELDATSKVRWARSPYNAANNQQGVFDKPSEFDDLDEGGILGELHRRLIQKTVSTLRAHGNVVYEVMNAPADDRGDPAFVAAGVAELDAALEDVPGSRLIAVNVHAGEAAIALDPRVDVVSVHVNDPADARGYAMWQRPVIFSNEGDPSESSDLGASAEARAARLEQLATALRAFPVGSAHLWVRDRDLGCGSARSFDETPALECVSEGLVSRLRAWAEPTFMGGFWPESGCPVGLRLRAGPETEWVAKTGPWSALHGAAIPVGGLLLAAGESGEVSYTAPPLPAGIYRVTAEIPARPGRNPAVAYTKGSLGEPVRVIDQGSATGTWYADLGLFAEAPSFRVGVADASSPTAVGAITYTLESCEGAGPLVPECPSSGPGKNQRLVRATFADGPGWHADLAARAPDGRTSGAGAGSGTLTLGAFDACDPPGEEQVAGVKVVVSGHSGRVRVAGTDIELGGPDLLEAAPLELPKPAEGWTWAAVRRVTVALQADAGTQVDAVQLLVEYDACTPYHHQGCVGSATSAWMDGCGAVLEEHACEEEDVCVSSYCADGVCAAALSELEPCPAHCSPNDGTIACTANARVGLDSCGAVATVEACNDGDPCTVDSCSAAGCAHVAVQSPECGGCTPMAELGCIADAQVWLDSCGNIGFIAGSCEDGNPCTVDACEPFGLVCTHTVSEEPECTSCPPEVGKACALGNVVWVDGCGQPGEVVETCDDGDPCTDDACDPLGQICTHVSTAAEGCPDCSLDLALECSGNALVEKDGCGNRTRVLALCTDGDPCTVDVCDPVLSVCNYDHVASTPECEACPPRAVRECVEGHVRWRDACGDPGALVHLCDDGDPCTTDTCDPVNLNCKTFPSGAPFCSVCTDLGEAKCYGASLIRVDSCGQILGIAELCDDSDPCTTDHCEAGTPGGCTHDPVESLFCGGCDTLPPACEGGVLLSRSECGGVDAADHCDDGDPCTVDSCPDGAAACEHVPGPCPSCQPAGEVCREGGLRSIDSCGQVGALIDGCDDGDACTDDACDPLELRCAHVPSGAPGCDDCAHATATACWQGALVTVDACGRTGAVVSDCSDDDPCTRSACDPEIGSCAWAPSSAGECLDCIPGVRAECMNGDLVWVDSCGQPGGVAIPCDDGDPCTTDSCDATNHRCVHSAASCPPPEPCDSEEVTVCRDGHLERLGACGQRVAIVDACVDADPCTIDGCDPETAACTATPVADPDCGTPAPEPSPCRASATLACDGLRLVWMDACGQPAGLARHCDDGDPCTKDACNPDALICVHTGVDSPECEEPLPEEDLGPVEPAPEADAAEPDLPEPAVAEPPPSNPPDVTTADPGPPASGGGGDGCTASAAGGTAHAVVVAGLLLVARLRRRWGRLRQ